MEEKKSNNTVVYIVGAVGLYLLGYKAGQRSVHKQIQKEWRKVNFGKDVDFPLFYPKVFEKEVVHFFDVIGSQLKELEQIKGGN